MTTLQSLSPADLKRLAALAGTSYDALRHVARGRRHMSSTAAIAVEKAGNQMGLSLRREDLAHGCSGCEFAKRCRK